MVNPALDWLGRAKSSYYLAIAKETEGVIELEDRCFQLQQCVEKSLKALLLFFQQEPPKTHDLVLLTNILESVTDLPSWIGSVGDLNDYAITTRYPGGYTPVVAEEFESAAKTAAKVIEWVSSVIDGIK